MGNPFVGRSDVYQQLRSWLLEPQGEQLRIISVEGAGGIGKTTLIKEVLRSVDLPNLGFLVLELRGEDLHDEGNRRDPVSVLVGVAERARIQLPETESPYFRGTLELGEANEDLIESVRRNIREQMGDEAADAARGVIRTVFGLGVHLGKVAPKTKEWVDFTSYDEEELQNLEDRVHTAANAFKLGGRFLDTFKRFRKHAKNQDRLARDTWQAMGEDFAMDLGVILCGWGKFAASQGVRAKTFKKKLPPKVNGKDRLFLFVDDYECMQNEFGKMLLVDQLLPVLARAPFKSTLLISGRDSLPVTNPAWKRFGFQQLKERTIRLQPLRESDIRELLEARSVPGDIAETAKTIFRETEGYPLLVEMAIDDYGEDGIPFVSLKEFYDRQTCWMTNNQRTWLNHLCFLEVVNEDSIGRLFGENLKQEIFDWFEAEGTIRDTWAAFPVVRPFVKNRVLKYLEMRSPEQFMKTREMVGA